MYNLFIKDFYLIKKHLWIGVFYSFMMFFIFNPQAFEIQGMVYSMGIAMIGYTMIMYVTAYDDKNNSEVMLNSLPITRSKIVLTRYISVILFALIGAMNMLIAGFLLKTFNILEVTRLMKIGDFLGALVGLCILSFLYLPIYFKLGYLKAKMFNLLLFAISFSGPIIMRNLLQDMDKPLWIDKMILALNAQPNLNLVIYLLGLLLIIGIVSYNISLMIYRRREF